MFQELKIANEETMDKNTLRDIDDKFRTILKAIDLLGCDLFEDVTDPMSQKYFHGRIDYLMSVAGARDITLIDHSYLRSLYTLFNNYYIAYQCPLPGDTVSQSDKERFFIYSEINQRLEDLQLNY